MGSLRSQLGKKLKVQVIPVEWEGETYIFSGLPSTEAMLNMGTDEKAKEVAVIWNVKFCATNEDGTPVKPAPELFKEESVGHIKVVQRYLQVEPGEQPYTLTDIAEIYATQPLLFAKFFGAAMKCLSGKEVTLGEVEAKNWLAEYGLANWNSAA